MFLISRVKTCITARKYLIQILRSFCFYDKNLAHLRNKAEYKNLTVPSDLNWQELISSISSELSFKVKGEDIQCDEFFSYLQKRENVMILSTSQVKDTLSLMAKYKVDAHEYSLALKFLDEKCALSAERLPLDLSFYFLDAWAMILGSKAFKKHYYSAITSMWSRRIRKMTPSNLILVLYFIGLSKYSEPFLMDCVLEKMESNLSNFSDEEIALVCLSFFKCSKRIDSSLFLQKSCETAENLLKKQDTFNAISILKLLRLSRYYDSQLWDLVKKYAIENSSTFNVVECTSFLALFSTQNIHDYELFLSLERQATLALRREEESGTSEMSYKTHPSLRTRVKDIARFLWALTFVGHPLNDDTLSCVTHFVEKRLSLKEYEFQVHVLVDTLQSFVLANHYHKNIFSELNLFTYKRILHSDMAKPKYQLLFVEKSVMIEQPEISIPSMKITNPIPRSLEKDISNRNGFQKLTAFLHENFPHNYKCCYIIPHIMIAGVLFAKPCNMSSDVVNTYQKFISRGIISRQVQDMMKKNHDYFCIEILDSSVCSGEANIPIGLMQTKIRQLKVLGFNVITLTEEDIINIEHKGIPVGSKLEILCKQ